MARITIADWCDFVRGLADPALEKSILEHLSKSEDAPGSTLRLMKHVEAAAKQDREHVVPKEAVQGAQAIFDLWRPEAAPFRLLPFDLTFDSFRQAPLAGTRSSPSTNRQVIIETVDFIADIHLEQTTYPDGRAVLGQLLRRGESNQPVPSATILVLCKNGQVNRTKTGQFGEFQSVALEDDPLALFMLVNPGDCIRLSFVDL